MTSGQHTPTYSLVVTVYKARAIEEIFRRTVGCLLRQTCPDWELVFVNDCSPDDSAAMLEEYRRQDGRIRIITHQRNLGLGMARNTGIRHARGEYIFLVDQDDYVSPHTLAITESLARKYNRPDMIQFRHDGGPEALFRQERYDNPPPRKFWHRKSSYHQGTDALRQFLLCRSSHSLCFRAVKSSLFRQLRLPETYPDDFFPSAHLSVLARSLVLCRMRLFYYLYQGQSMTHTAGNQKTYHALLFVFGQETISYLRLCGADRAHPLPFLYWQMHWLLYLALLPAHYDAPDSDWRSWARLARKIPFGYLTIGKFLLQSMWIGSLRSNWHPLLNGIAAKRRCDRLFRQGA